MSHACREIIKHQQEQQKRSGKSKRSLRRVQKEIKDTISNYDKEFPVFIEDIRLSKFKMERVKTRVSQRASHARGIERFQLPSIAKASIVGSMPMTLDRHTKTHVRATYHSNSN